ncbi:MAG: 50S ribosomal protein L25 [bacterium]|nr:50S ribosomal protein L25 [bacterium]
MENLTLVAHPRTILGKKVKKIRENGKIPIILYGHGIESQPLTVDKIQLSQLFKQAGISTLVDLKIDEQKAFKILFHEPQRDPCTNSITHADLYKVKMTEKIRTEIPLEFVGESLAVTELEGNLIIIKDSVEVECLPDALVPNISVDLSKIKTFDDVLHISDIQTPEKIEILDDPEETIVSVSAPRTEEELEEELAAPTAEEEQAAIDQVAGTEEEPAEEVKEEK